MPGPRDLVVRFLADTRAFLSGTDDVERAYDDMARDADRVADASEDGARRMARAYDRAGDEIRRTSQATGRDLKADVADTGREAGQEFATNLGASLSSGDTSRIVQDSAGGLIGSLAFAGPLGAAAAAGGALALGLWNAFAEKTRQREEAIRAAASDVYQGLLDDGANFVKQYGEDVLRGFLDPATEDALVTSARKAARALRFDLAGAIAGGPGSIAAAADTARGRWEALQARTGTGIGMRKVREEQAQLQAIIDYLGTLEQGWQDATGAVDAYKDAINGARRAAKLYASEQSSYAVGGSTYQSQLGAAGRYVGGQRRGGKKGG